MTDDELRELLALAAVGALSDEEQMSVDAALERRPDLRAELDGLRAVAAIMADVVAEAPPTALRGRLLDAIADTPQLAPEPRQADVVPITAARSHRRWLAVGSVAAAVIALLVGVLVVSPFGDSETDDEVAAVVDAGDAVQIPMSGSLAGLTIVHSPSEDAAVLLADDVPVPADDRVYELWAFRGGTPERYATFRPDDDGRLEVYAAGLDPASAEQWAITEEPAGGSDVPTLPILATTA